MNDDETSTKWLQKILNLSDVDEIKRQLEDIQNVNDLKQGNESLLMLATVKKNYNLLKVLVELGANPSLGTHHNNPFLYCTFSKPDNQALELFLQSDARPPVDDYGYNCAHLASLNKDPKMLSIVLSKYPALHKHKTTRKYKNIATGSTPLHIAIIKKSNECIDILMSFKADFFAKNDDHIRAGDLPQCNGLCEYLVENEDFVSNYVYNRQYKLSIPSDPTCLEFKSYCTRLREYVHDTSSEEPTCFISCHSAQKSVVDLINSIMKLLRDQCKRIRKKSDAILSASKVLLNSENLSKRTAAEFLQMYNNFIDKNGDFNLETKALSDVAQISKSLSTRHFSTQIILETAQYFNPLYSQEIASTFKMHHIDNDQYLIHVSEFIKTISTLFNVQYAQSISQVQVSYRIAKDVLNNQ